MGAWISGLIAAGVSAGANAITIFIVDPTTFTFSGGGKKLLTFIGVNALLSVAFYLRQSPIPPGPGEGPRNSVIGSKLRFPLILAAILSGAMFGASCAPKTTTHKLAIYTANADAGLIALTDSIALLNASGRMNKDAARSVYQINLRIAGALDLIRDRAQSGYSKKEVLTILDTILTDLTAAETAGLLGLTGRDREKFLQVTFFAQFAVRSIQAIVAATKEPQVPETMMREALATPTAGEETLWTDLVLILQTAVLRGISQSRMSAEEAFADGARLSLEVKASLTAKIAAL